MKAAKALIITSTDLGAVIPTELQRSVAQHVSTVPIPRTRLSLAEHELTHERVVAVKTL
jgi:hypothetical protein